MMKTGRQYRAPGGSSNSQPSVGRRFHVVHIIDNLSLGGSERMLAEIANATDKSLYKVTVCVTRSNTAFAHMLGEDITLLQLGRRSRFDFTGSTELAGFCRRQHVDLLHIHGSSSFVFVTLLWLCRQLPKRLSMVMHDHNGDVELYPHLPLSFKLSLRLVRPVYVGVHPTLSSLAIEAGVPRNRVFTIRNAIDLRPYLRCLCRQGLSSVGPCEATPTTQSVKTSAKLAEGLSPQGIMIANLRPSKDIMLLLNALATIKDLPWRMKLVGLAADPQYAEECRKMLTDLCLSGRVEFVGPRVDVPELLKEADFAVLSSKTESGPLALIEYVAAELPFVSTRVGLVGRYLDSVGVTEFVAPEDIEQFSTALRRLLGLSPEERRARGQAGRRIAGGYFDIHQVIPAWYEVYNKALGAAS